MKLDFRQAQKQVHKIKQKLGQRPATFDDSLPIGTEPRRRLTCTQIFLLVILALMLAVVWASVLWILIDLSQK